jgi:hypothetical protein
MLGYLRALIRYRQGHAEGLQAVASEVMVNPELATVTPSPPASSQIRIDGTGRYRYLMVRPVRHGWDGRPGRR